MCILWSLSNSGVVAVVLGGASPGSSSTDVSRRTWNTFPRQLTVVPNSTAQAQIGKASASLPIQAGSHSRKRRLGRPRGLDEPKANLGVSSSASTVRPVCSSLKVCQSTAIQAAMDTVQISAVADQVCGMPRASPNHGSERRGQHRELPGAQPADPPGGVRGDGHACHGLQDQVAPGDAVVCVSRDYGAPEEIPNQMVFADVVGEVVDAAGPPVVSRKDGIPGRIGDLVQVSLAEHVALADDAGRNANNVDGAVELDVGGGHEHFVQTAAAVLPHPPRQGLGAGSTRLGGGSEKALALGRGAPPVIDDVDDDGQLVDEFVGPCRGRSGGSIAHELVDHAPQDAGRDPNVAVYDPYDVPGGLSVRPADVSYLGIRPQSVDAAIGAMQDGVLVLDQDLRIVRGKVFDEAPKKRIRRVACVLYAEANGQLLAGVVLAKRGGDALIQIGLQALDRPDDGDARRIGTELGGYGRRGASGKETESGRPKKSREDELDACRRRTGTAGDETRLEELFLHGADAHSLDKDNSHGPDKAYRGYSLNNTRHFSLLGVRGITIIASRWGVNNHVRLWTDCADIIDYKESEEPVRYLPKHSELAANGGT
ncbi:hypothetical protein Trco_001548 [Trichoderma cornu-damae]|uniref:Uncharacterized protein n=1 Tax=Trichoderma cornu-damae TaxID=654480 RepID=A0A9P8U0B3_9HYPO|nr:hypothetical protein Trco_001548 [Trichoderma cornu-damae]